MSFQFSDTTNLKGLVQMYEDECGYDPGDVSGNVSLLKKFTANANSALDDFFAIAIQASGKWQIDDSNYEDTPTIYADLVAGQREYSFLEDEEGNLILDIYRVFIRGQANGPYSEIYPVDKQSEDGTQGLTDEQNSQGTPWKYDKTGNVIALDPIPETSITEGLKAMINREGSYFEYTDDEKKPGIPGLFHAYLYMKPALRYSRKHQLKNYNQLRADILQMEKDIKEYFGLRSKDERPVLRDRTANIPFY